MANDMASDHVRACFINPGSTVPRTAAMALSDTFITLLNQIAGCGESGAMLPLTPGGRADLYGEGGQRPRGTYGRDALHRYPFIVIVELKLCALLYGKT